MSTTDSASKVSEPTMSDEPSANQPSASEPSASEPSASRDDAMISIAELKAKCKALNIKGYSKKNKDEIVKMLLKDHGDDPEIQKIELLVENTKSLKNICCQMKLKGYSVMKKNELVELILDTRNKNKELQEAICAYVDSNQDYLRQTTQNVLRKCFEETERKNMNLTLKQMLECFETNEKFENYLVKTLFKLISKKHKTTKLAKPEKAPKKPEQPAPKKPEPPTPKKVVTVKKPAPPQPQTTKKPHRVAVNQHRRRRR